MMGKESIQNYISTLKTAGICSEIDIHFARFILAFSNDPDPDIFLAAALVSRATIFALTSLPRPIQF